MAPSVKASETLSSGSSRSSIVSQKSTSNGLRMQQTTGYDDCDLPPDSNTRDVPPDANKPTSCVRDDDPLDDSFDECSDSDDEPEPMRRTSSFGKSAFRCISKLVKKNQSLDVPLLPNASGYSRTKSSSSVLQHSQMTSTPSHTIVQHTSNDCANVPMKMKAGKPPSSPYLNWAINGSFTASQ